MTYILTLGNIEYVFFHTTYGISPPIIHIWFKKNDCNHLKKNLDCYAKCYEFIKTIKKLSYPDMNYLQTEVEVKGKEREILCKWLNDNGLSSEKFENEYMIQIL